MVKWLILGLMVFIFLPINVFSASLGSAENPFYTYIYDGHITLGYVNTTTFIITNETDPLWEANYSAFNDTWALTYNETYDVLFSDNVTWNETLGNELYYSIQNLNNFIIDTYNVTYDTYDYRANNSLLETYNVSYDALIGATGNTSWNETLGNELYYSISNPNSFIIDTYNSTYDTYNYRVNDTLIRTYNSTYDSLVSFPGFSDLITDYGFTDNSANWDTAFGWGDYRENNTLLDTYNLTYDAIVGDNTSWTETVATGLYYSITNPDGFISSFAELDPFWSANYTLFNTSWSNMYNESYMINTYNSTYDLKPDNTFNSTYDTWAYNQTLPAINYADSLLITTFYNATNLQAVRGTTVGTIGNITAYDNQAYNVTEVSGATGLDFRVNFTDITEFNQLVVRYRSTLGESHTMDIGIWSYDLNIWESYATLGEAIDYNIFTLGVFDTDDHVSPEGNVSVRFYTTANGNIGHIHYFDWVTISKGPATPSGAETDPYSIHLDNTTILTIFNTTVNQWLYNQTTPAQTWSAQNFVTLNNTTINQWLYNQSTPVMTWAGARFITLNNTSVMTNTYNSTYDTYNYRINDTLIQTYNTTYNTYDYKINTTLLTTLNQSINNQLGKNTTAEMITAINVTTNGYAFNTLNVTKIYNSFFCFNPPTCTANITFNGTHTIWY